MAAPSPITLPAVASPLAVPTWDDATVRCVKVFTDDAAVSITNQLQADLTADGITLVTNDVVLAVTASPHVHSGIYLVASGGTVRHPNADAAGDFVANLRVPISSGTTYGGRTARYAGVSSPTLGTSGLPFVFDPQVITPPA
jgi:hypothetical protein